MSRVRIPAQPDLVLIAWIRNPLVPGSRRTITAVRVIGSARPCVDLLRPGRRLSAALRCLRRNGFVVVVSERTSNVSGFVLLKRS
ncbi:hypothetical protein [Paenibacillus flagellatus]|uniref:Uncharacterized protein n=1 Tax=Paenibacillus flagellatus TaxID=2211139 RepID=A0A2V5K9W8_9BACL|nr:hypothetical protein [Paenibacillus flagellatus]PYI54844.1 hypothetical protein DLM86_09840 [Paenibacillus flagellatus]